MLHDALTIAGDSYRDANRRKGVVYFLLLMAVLQVSVFALYRDISLGIEDKLIKDFGLAMLTFVGVLSALTAAFQIPRELRDRTAMTLFAKPLGREAYLLGKVIGVGGLALRNMLAVGLGILWIFNMNGILSGELTLSYIQSFILSFAAAVDIVALTVLLSLFLSEGAVIIVAMIAYFLGNAAYMISVTGSGMAAIATLLKYVLPNFFLLDIKTEASAGLAVSAPYVMLSAAYALAYAVALLTLSMMLFRKRDL